MEHEHDLDDNLIDPDPLSVIIELFNLVTQPGSLTLIGTVASVIGTQAALSQVNMMREEKKAREQNKSLSKNDIDKIRRNLYQIDLALIQGFASLSTIASFFDQYDYFGNRMLVGNAPITGYKNAQKVRRAHEDGRAAVKEARDAFMELSLLVPPTPKNAEIVGNGIARLNELASFMVGIGDSYARALLALADGLATVDRLISDLGEDYDYTRTPRDYSRDLAIAFPKMRDYTG